MKRSRYRRHPMPRLLDGNYLRWFLHHRETTQKAVIRCNKLLRPNSRIKDPPLAAHTWIDNGNVNGIRRVPTRRLCENNRPGLNIARRYRMRQIDDLRTR